MSHDRGPELELADAKRRMATYIEMLSKFERDGSDGRSLEVVGEMIANCQATIDRLTGEKPA